MIAAKRMSGEPAGLAALLGDGVGATLTPGDGDGESVPATPPAGVGVLDTLLACAEGDAEGAGVEVVTALLDGVTIVGKIEPFRICPANRMKSKQAKMPPYSGDNKIPLHPFVSAAKLKSASPSVGAA